MRRTVHTSAAGGRSGGLVSIATNDTQGMGPFMLRGAHVPGESSMNMSAILVLVRPDRMDAAVATLNDTCGVEVHCRDDATGRLIVVLEAPSIDDEVAGMRGIQALAERPVRGARLPLLRRGRIGGCVRVRGPGSRR